MWMMHCYAENHIILLEKAFQRLRDHNLKINIRKCVLARQEVSYLGFNLSGRGVGPDKDKIRQSRTWYHQQL